MNHKSIFLLTFLGLLSYQNQANSQRKKPTTNNRLSSLTFTNYTNIDQISFEEPSDIVYHSLRKTLFVVGDEGSISEFTTDGRELRHAEFDGLDFEGITCNPESGLLYVVIEDERRILEINPDNYKVLRFFQIDNFYHGHNIFSDSDESIEGITFVPDSKHPQGGTFIVTKQSTEPEDATNPSLIIQLELPLKTGHSYNEKAKLLRLSRQPIPDFSAVCFDTKFNHLLIISDSQNTLYEFNMDLKLIQKIKLPGKDQEGLAIDDSGKIYIAQDSGGIFKN